MAWNGLYKPVNKEKYLGNINNICYRSKLEYRYMKWLDMNDDIIQWSSEELFIYYLSPVDKRVHKYFPDFLIKTKNEDTILIEIKPKSQCSLPTKGFKNQRRFLRESITFAINSAKWEAAERFCSEKGWVFQVITEKDLAKLG